MCVYIYETKFICLGFVRKELKNNAPRSLILKHCIVRVMKCILNEKLRSFFVNILLITSCPIANFFQISSRDKLRELRIPSEEPYRKVVLAFLNKLLRPHRNWWKKTVKLYLRNKFVECLSNEEANENYDLR
jgi:hypothetical protein